MNMACPSTLSVHDTCPNGLYRLFLPKHPNTVGSSHSKRPLELTPSSLPGSAVIVHMPVILLGHANFLQIVGSTSISSQHSH